MWYDLECSCSDCHYTATQNYPLGEDKRCPRPSCMGSLEVVEQRETRQKPKAGQKPKAELKPKKPADKKAE